MRLCLFVGLWLAMLAGPGRAFADGDSTERAVQPAVRSFSQSDLSTYRSNPDYQYYRETPQPLETKEKEKVNKPPRYQPVSAPKGPRGDFSGVGKVILWIMIIGIVVVFLYQMIKVDWRKVFGGTADQAVVEVPDEEEVEDIRDLSFEKLVQDAIDQKRYRHAVRLLYLNSLKQLQERGLIHWKKEKTNHEYARELGQHALRPQFDHLTFLFEYIWYGEFPVDLDHFNLARAGFMEFDQSLRTRYAK